ncbi:MAG TPA: hypothetical protein VMS31_13050, partial [Pyrinomonadaceae bacterium]|nr:hypothetical protein [Pyrinomonadaceae bacterium]
MINLFFAAAFCLIVGAGHAAAAQSCIPGRDQVALFTDDNFAGTCVTLRARDYPSPSSVGMVNDSVSSVRVGADVQAVLCVDDGYGGECELFTADVPRLTGSSIGNDRASSVKVQPRGFVQCQPGANEIALYKHKDFVAPCRRIGPGEYRLLANATLPNDSISSVKLGSNVRAVLCDVKDYQGTCRLFHGDDARLSGPSLEDNTVSSAWVFRRTSYRLPSSIFVGRRNNA